MIVMTAASDLEDDAPAGPEEAVDLGLLPGLIGYALRRAQLAVFQDFHRHFAAADIRPAQFSVLVVLRHNPGLRATRVAAALGIKRTNFVPLFDGLAARGLVERRPVKGDRRASALFLTEAGAATLARLERLVGEHEAKFAARLGPDGRYQLMGLLHRLTEPAFDPG
jgi:DNA-binding MarR family transcriptional regulator